MSILNTARGEEWLKLFKPSDKDYAIALANGLDFVSHDAFSNGLTSELKRVRKKYGRVALFAAREIRTEETNDPKFTYFGPKTTSRPNAIGPGAGVGSEGSLSTLIRNLAIRYPRSVLDHPSIASMKRARVRAIVIVDDLIGSGKRAADFIRVLYAHRTIKSWMSLKYVALHVAAYSATKKGRKRLEHLMPRPNITYVRPCPTFSNRGWPDALRFEITRICRDYAARARTSHFELGFQDSRALLVFQHGCPNNVPGIIWGPGAEWHALFPAKPLPGDIAMRAASPYESLITAVRRLRQSRLANNPDLQDASMAGAKLIMFLTAVPRFRRQDESLSLYTGLSLSECSDLRRQCRDWGMLDNNSTLTKGGRSELDRLRAESSARPRVDTEAEYYYPKSLRTTINSSGF